MIPESLGRLTNMEELYLDGNQLTGESPEWTQLIDQHDVPTLELTM